MLRLECATRRTAPAFPLVMLALAVFLWGLHYKLSLYRAETPQHSPAAKLLSQRERPVSSRNLDIARQPSPSPQSLALYPLLLVPCALLRSQPAACLEAGSLTFDNESDQQPSANASPFSSRPPPALFSLA